QNQPLIDPYAVYQLLMDQWADTLQDDVYAISAEGWRAETYRLTETTKAGKLKDRGWACDLVPKELVARRFLADDLEMIEALTAELEEATSRLAELEEEHGGEEGFYAELDKLTKAAVAARLKELRKDPEAEEERRALEEWLRRRKPPASEPCATPRRPWTIRPMAATTPSPRRRCGSWWWTTSGWPPWSRRSPVRWSG
ncbi:MAG: hypothetical protein ACKO45_10755, partial [Cyanobium sp.]